MDGREKPLTVKIKKSNRKGKKLMAEFMINENRKKTIHFGAEGMSDFTKHKDKERKQRYIKRHRKNENWNNPLTAGALSRWILWEEKNIQTAIKKFGKRFKIKIL